MSTIASDGPGRHEARERALGLLYEAEIRELSGPELIESLPLAPATYAQSIVQGLHDGGERVDELINEHSEGWTVDRLPNVDRAILRLAIWELIEQIEVPAAVVIDEAVELAKEYSTERSSGFVNGVLDSVARAVRP